MGICSKITAFNGLSDREAREKRDRVIEFLSNKGIETRPGFFAQFP